MLHRGFLYQSHLTSFHLQWCSHLDPYWMPGNIPEIFMHTIIFEIVTQIQFHFKYNIRQWCAHHSNSSVRPAIARTKEVLFLSNSHLVSHLRICFFASFLHNLVKILEYKYWPKFISKSKFKLFWYLKAHTARLMMHLVNNICHLNICGVVPTPPHHSLDNIIL